MPQFAELSCKHFVTAECTFAALQNCSQKSDNCTFAAIKTGGNFAAAKSTLQRLNCPPFPPPSLSPSSRNCKRTASTSRGFDLTVHFCGGKFVTSSAARSKNEIQFCCCKLDFVASKMSSRFSLFFFFFCMRVCVCVVDSKKYRCCCQAHVSSRKCVLANRQRPLCSNKILQL